MIGYRRKSFEHAVQLLRGIEAVPDEISSLLDCQRFLVREITGAEDHITAKKQELKKARKTLKTARPSKADANLLREKIVWLQNQISEYQDLNYIWRCFGDALAFIYLDKYALKNVYYETESCSVKQDAGFLSGKSGLVREISFVEKLSELDVPSVLVDLTNTIRYGDVCLLCGPDPLLIEVKAAGKFNQRGQRQIHDIGKLHDFFEQDHAMAFHGLEELRRVFVPGEISYIDDLNSCIDAAELEGFAYESPEAGLYYAAFFGNSGDVSEVLRRMNFDRPQVFMLNVFKSNKAWAPYFPFTLSIRKSEHLFDFIRGHLILLVVLDVSQLCRHAERPGCEVSFVLGDDMPLQISRLETGSQGFLGKHILNRIAFEFVSPHWLVKSWLSRFDELVDV